MRKPHTVIRMRKRVKTLIDQFDECVEVFDQTNPFTGPSVYFHKKTLEIQQRHIAPCDVLWDDLFFDYLYATLTAWGLHRMGPDPGKLTEIEELRSSFQKQEGRIRALHSLAIDNIPEGKVSSVTSGLWDVLDSLQIRTRASRTKIVANSKALHHLLPDLVPPIDGAYTLKFFYNDRTTALNQGDEIAFREIYPHLCHIASACATKIQTHIGHGMNTSKTKVIDNAIVGCVLQGLPE